MRPARALLLIASVVALSAACTSGQTQVQGLPESTETARPSGPTATGPNGATGAAGGAFSLELGEYPAEVRDVAFFTCNGLEGTWRYIFNADFGLGIVMDIDAEVDMAGGDGTLVFGGQFDLQDLGPVSFTDTIDLRLVGTRGLKATNVVVDVDTAIPGFTEDIFQTFPQTGTLPIVPGSDRC